MVANSNSLPGGCLLDSGIFIAAERRSLAISALMRGHEHLPHAMSSITAAELLIGVNLSPPERRKRRLATIEDYFARFAVLDFDIHCARLWAGITAELRTSGTIIGAHDLLIAATALRHNYAIVTFNHREFSRVQNLMVFSPNM